MAKFKMNNSKGENLTDWLYQNGYGYIYEKWLKMPNELWDFVKAQYPEIWRKFNKN